MFRDETGADLLIMRFVVTATLFSSIAYIALTSLDQGTSSAEEQLLGSEAQRLINEIDCLYELGGVETRSIDLNIPRDGRIRVECRSHQDNVLHTTYRGVITSYTTDARIHGARLTNESLTPVAGDIIIGPGQYTIYLQASTVGDERVVLVAPAGG